MNPITLPPVIARDGTARPFDADRIRKAIAKAVIYHNNGLLVAQPTIAHDLTNQVIAALAARFSINLDGMPIEAIQDVVEQVLMESGHTAVAKGYIIYRASRSSDRDSAKSDDGIVMTLANGETRPLDMEKIGASLAEACEGLAVDADKILEEFKRGLYTGVSERDVQNAILLAGRTLIEANPDYSLVTARLLLTQLRRQAYAIVFGDSMSPTKSAMARLYPDYFERTVGFAIDKQLLDPALLERFDLRMLGAALRPERDYQFTYMGLQTLADRYFLQHEDKPFELPQAFFMRVAMGLALRETDPNARAIEFYELLSSFDYMASTPTLFNAGTLHSQLSSCYLTTVPDDLLGIYHAITDNAMLSKWAGGLGNDWTPVRALGARIRGTNGKSQGVVPFLKVANDTAVAVNQGGKRKGAVCAYLETWHMDIEEFLEMRKNTGDERRRTHDMNTANWIPDLFMKRVFNDAEWTLFSPSDTPDLHDLYGPAFEARYAEYEAMTRTGEITFFKRMEAKTLWRKMLGMLFETGHPWLTFKDACNLRSPQQHVGVVHSSNLCTEITLNTSADEIAVCNLGSINLVAHLKADGSLDHDKLKKTVRTALRMLDNVIDINYYAVDTARHSNSLHRPVGLGLMGFQDALYAKGIAYASEAAVEFADESMEVISYYALEASCDLAAERGAYATFKGSLWSQGILPRDSLKLLLDTRTGAGQTPDAVDAGWDKTVLGDAKWDELRQRIMSVGMRNSNVMAIAPTATISNIIGVTQSIEPTFENLFVKSNLSGEFTVINPYLVKELMKLGLWDSVMVADLKRLDGSVQSMTQLPQELRNLFACAFDLEPLWLVRAASRRQKWIDQAQSLNLYMGAASGKALDQLYRNAWMYALKTTYYLRALSATTVEKASANDGRLTAVATAPVAEPKACSIDSPDCEACQ